MRMTMTPLPFFLFFFLLPSRLGAIHSLLVSPDDLKVVTTSIDKMIKFFEILSFDMSHMISTEYVPTAAVWLSSERGLFNRVGVADQNSGAIRVYRADGGQQGILAEIGVHTQPVKYVTSQRLLSFSFPSPPVLLPIQHYNIFLSLSIWSTYFLC
jgi:hypothetical protein